MGAIKEAVHGKPHIWFEAVMTNAGPGTRVHYYANGRVCWGGSFPVRRKGNSFIEVNGADSKVAIPYMNTLQRWLK